MTRTNDESLREARAHFALMRQHAQGDLDDQLVIDAVCMRLSAGVEALSRVDQATRERLFGDAWPLMWGMRNRIAHGYLLVDAEIVRRTLGHDIPPWSPRPTPSEQCDEADGQPGEEQHRQCPHDSDQLVDDGLLARLGKGSTRWEQPGFGKPGEEQGHP